MAVAVRRAQARLQDFARLAPLTYLVRIPTAIGQCFSVCSVFKLLQHSLFLIYSHFRSDSSLFSSLSPNENYFQSIFYSTSFRHPQGFNSRVPT